MGGPLTIRLGRILHFIKVMNTKSFFVALIAGLIGMGLTWAFYRWGGDYAGARIGPVLAFGLSPILFAVLSFATGFLLVGDRPLNLLRLYWLPLPLFLCYVPLLLWMWGVRHDS